MRLCRFTKIFDRRDQNGRISFQEFITAYSLTQPGNLEDKIKYTFDKYDVDGSGFLDIDELYMVIVRLFNLLGGEKKVGVDCLKFAQSCVKRLDANKDGNFFSCWL